jgi:hypothetical protein
MRTKLVLLTVMLTLASGCFLGRTPSQKRSSYMVNGLGAALGTVVLLAALQSSTKPDSSCADANAGSYCGFGSGLGDAAVIFVGGSLLMGSTIMTAFTLLVPGAPEPAVVAPPKQAATGVVTTPGLAPTSVGVR